MALQETLSTLPIPAGTSVLPQPSPPWEGAPRLSWSQTFLSVRISCCLRKKLLSGAPSRRAACLAPNTNAWLFCSSPLAGALLSLIPADRLTLHTASRRGSNPSLPFWKQSAEPRARRATSSPGSGSGMRFGRPAMEQGGIRVGFQQLSHPGSLRASCQTPSCHHHHFDIQTLSSSFSSLILHATAILSPASQRRCSEKLGQLLHRVFISIAKLFQHF